MKVTLVISGTCDCYPKGGRGVAVRTSFEPRNIREGVGLIVFGNPHSYAIFAVTEPTLSMAVVIFLHRI